MISVPAVDLQQPGLAIGVEEEVIAVELEGVRAVGDQFLDCLEGLDDGPLDVGEGFVGLLEAEPAWAWGYLLSMKFLRLSRNHFPPMRLT